jgi:hypothetical protein
VEFGGVVLDSRQRLIAVTTDPNPTTNTPSSLIQAARPNPPESFRPRRRPVEKTLTFAPLAWLKLRLFLHTDEVEVGFFGISAESDLLYVEDLAVVQQRVTQVTVPFDDAAVADHFDQCADAGIGPARCGRVWVHTHPGSSPNPSATDEDTFERVFGSCDWAIMAIVARSGASYARLSFNAGPGGSGIIPVTVDWERLPKDLMLAEGTLDQLVSGWMDEYGTKVLPEQWPFSLAKALANAAEDPTTADQHWMDELDDLYDRHLLDDDYILEFEHGQEVYSW